MASNKMHLEKKSLWRVAILSTVILMGAVFTLAVYSAVHQWEHDLLDRQFQLQVRKYSTILEREISVEIAELKAISRFYENSTYVERDEFRNFVEPIIDLQSGIRAMAWIPKVAAADRLRHEADMRNDGFQDYRITELDESDRMIEAAARGEYFPATYVHPLQGNEIAMGFDVGSTPDRREALDAARDSGEPVATSRIRLVPTAPWQYGFLIAAPVYNNQPATTEQRREGLSGFVIGVYETEKFFGGGALDFESQNLNVSIRDLSAPDSERILFEDSKQEAISHRHHIPESPVDLSAAGRNWMLHTTPTEHFILANRRYESILILLGGLILTFLFAIVLGLRLREEGRVLRLFEERSQALMQSEERFRLLFEHASIGVAIMQEDGRLLLSNRALHEFLGYDPARLSGMNYRDIAHPADQVNDAALYRELLEGKRDQYSIEKRFMRPDGQTVWGRFGVSAVRDEHGALVQIIGMVADITHQKKSEQEILDSRSLLEATLESTADGILVIPPGRKWVIFNRRFAEMWRLPPDWVSGDIAEKLREHAVSQVEDPEQFLQRIYELNADLQSEAFDVLQMKDGRIFERYSIPQFIDGRAVNRVWSFRDATERKQAEEELRRERDYFTAIIENSLSGFDIVDHEGKFVYVNKSYVRMWGYDSPDEIIGSPAAGHCMDPTMTGVIIEKLKAKGHGVFEFAARRRDGSAFDVLMSIQLHRDKDDQVIYIGHSLDITERKQGEVERERLRSAIEQSSDIVIITDADGIIQYVNPAFERTTGFTRQEAIGNSPRIVKSGHHPPAFYHEMWQTLTGGRAWKSRFINKRKDGSIFTEEATISPVSDETGRIVNYVGVKRDITRELQLEEQYRQSQKMDAIGHLTGGVAHDFNNLLQVINGYTDIAKEELDPLNPAQEPLRQIAKAGERAARLVGQLLAFSRRQLLRPERLDLNIVTSDLTKMLHRVIGEHIQLIFHACKGNPNIHADRGMIEQIIMNLSINARDAMPGGGNLEIEIRNETLGVSDCEGQEDAEPGHYVLLQVSDTGCGMDLETLNRIFEPFFTTKEVGKGTGLGLSMVYGIVKQHKGLIKAFSKPGQGTTIRVYLPESDHRVEEEPIKPAMPSHGNQETILLAEDDPMVRRLTRRILEKARYRVLEAHNGEEAVSIFKERHHEIAAILLDVVMPRMSGREACERMLEINPKLGIVFATGYDDDELDTAFVEANGFSILQKPYAAEQLLMHIRAILDRTSR